ncbi:hypothetical protein Tco_1351258 [Tanacetum coccineum]
MSNSNINLQTQSSNALHNAIMEAGSKDRPPMLAQVPVAEGSSKTTIERYMENYKNVSQGIRDQLNAEAKAIQIILTGIDNNIYSIVDACPNACEMWTTIERLKQDRNSLPETEEKQLLPLLLLLMDPNLLTVTKIEMSKEKEIDKLIALISLSFKKIYKPTNNNLRTSSNTSQANQDNSLRINRGTGYDNQRAVNVAGARENVEFKLLQIQLTILDQSLMMRPIISNDIYLTEQSDTNITIDSSDICYDRPQDDQDKTGDLDQERFQNEEQNLESSNNHFKEANNELSKINQLMFKDLKKFQAELDKYNDVNYASNVEIDCAKAKGI